MVINMAGYLCARILSRGHRQLVEVGVAVGRRLAKNAKWQADYAANGAPATSAQAGEGLGVGDTVVGGGKVIATEMEEVVDRVVDVQEALGWPDDVGIRTQTSKSASSTSVITSRTI